MTKSAMAVPGLEEGQVSTVKMEGSQWSKLTLLTTQNLAKSYCKHLNTHHHHHYRQVCRHTAVLQCCRLPGIYFVWSIIAVPGNNIKGRMIL